MAADSQKTPSMEPVRVGMLRSAMASGDEERVDFIATEAEVLTIGALDVMHVLAGRNDVSTALIHVVGQESAAVIAGQTLAIGAGARCLVADDLRSTRRVAVMMGQVMQA